MIIKWSIRENGIAAHFMCANLFSVLIIVDSYHNSNPNRLPLTQLCTARGLKRVSWSVLSGSCYVEGTLYCCFLGAPWGKFFLHGRIRSFDDFFVFMVRWSTAVNSYICVVKVKLLRQKHKQISDLISACSKWHGRYQRFANLRAVSPRRFEQQLFGLYWYAPMRYTGSMLSASLKPCYGFRLLW